MRNSEARKLTSDMASADESDRLHVFIPRTRRDFATSGPLPRKVPSARSPNTEAANQTAQCKRGSALALILPCREPHQRSCQASGPHVMLKTGGITMSRKATVAFLVALTMLTLAALGARSKQEPASRPVGTTGRGPVNYEFGRPVRPDEHTYEWYRSTHAKEAAARYGLSPDAVGDGMDTWHWWTGVDNPGFWRQVAIASSKGGAGNLLGVKSDFLRLLTTVPRNKRFELIGLINDPDAVAAEKPDQYGLMIDRMKAGTLKWDPEKFGYSSGVIGLQLFPNKKFDP